MTNKVDAFVRGLRVGMSPLGALASAKNYVRMDTRVRELQSKLTELDMTGNGKTKRATDHREQIFVLLEESDMLNRRRI
jgi:hypothetical protein